MKKRNGTDNKMETKNTTLPEQLQNQIIKVVKRGKINTPNSQIHDHSLGRC